MEGGRAIGRDSKRLAGEEDGGVDGEEGAEWERRLDSKRALMDLKDEGEEGRGGRAEDGRERIAEGGRCGVARMTTRLALGNEGGVHS